jgi:hypothetical protein
LIDLCAEFIDGDAIFLLKDIIVDGEEVVILLLSLLVDVDGNCNFNEHVLFDVDWYLLDDGEG